MWTRGYASTVSASELGSGLAVAAVARHVLYVG